MRRHGTEASRVILEKQNQQRAARGETPLEYVIPEEPHQFDVEHAKDNSEAIEQLRKGRAGTPLSEIRPRSGVAPAETDET